MNIDIVKNLNLDKKDQVKFVNFANFAMRFFEVKIIQAELKKRYRPQYKLTSKKEQVERELKTSKNAGFCKIVQKWACSKSRDIYKVYIRWWRIRSKYGKITM